MSGALKAAARAAVDRHAEELIALSERLHADPETAWEEHRAAASVPGLLDRAGFDVTAAYLGLDTAFHARFGSGPVRIALCAEYDALPGLGHACGHNLIAASSVGAALGLAAVADGAGLTVEVYGTPAEEGGGGKIEMLDRGAFTGVDLAMMVHPAPVDVAEARPFAVSHSRISCTGRSAHAAAYPETGINAADAFTVAQVAIGLLRQQLPASARVHGVVTHAGDALLVPVFGRLSDRVGREPVFVAATTALLVLSTPAFLLTRTGLAGTWIAGLLLGAILGTYAVWAAEIFPTRTRQSGLSVAYNITAALFAGTVPYLMTVLVSATGSPLVPGPYLMVFATGGLAAALTLKETAGRALLRPEDVDGVPAGPRRRAGAA
ncbi:MFS transporter [Streptomyces griseoviridis]|uniref:Peptidase M20 domain-containing protein 2 n=1 Tax=Streptomyces griseoviridis TaxID=45398 RepID=A0ABT9L7E6_STRGD|nr:MFS transporter [Streptomyces griseoviridis]MDP9679632.1 hypothetical protein [Streptomyces griseoviridis]GGS99770.1 hypothetical protein GCM10010240_36430 [Streptomyces griseoviridis]